MRSKFAVVAVAFSALTLGGYSSPFKAPEPGPDCALIADHMVEGTAGFDYTLLQIDGKNVQKEKVPALVDMNPRVIATPGKHTFKVSVMPHVRRPDSVAHEATFTAEVAGGTTYFVGTTDGQPVLKTQ